MEIMGQRGGQGGCDNGAERRDSVVAEEGGGKGLEMGRAKEAGEGRGDVYDGGRGEVRVAGREAVVKVGTWGGEGHLRW